MFRAIHASVSQLMPALSFYIALYDTRSQAFTFPYFSDQQHATPAARPRVGGKTEYVMRTGRPLLATADTLTALQQQGDLELTDGQPVSYLGVPLTSDHASIGVVAVQSNDPNVRYTEEDRDILAFVSTQIAAVIRRQVAREENARTRDFYLSLLDEFPTPVWRASTLEVYDYFNRSWLAFTGRTLGQELGDGWTESIHPEDVHARREQFRQALTTLQPFHTEYRLRHCSGDYRWVLDVGRPFTAADGSLAGYIGTCYDITERKQAEEALRESERKLRGLIDYSTDGVALEDEQGIVVEWNPAMERITGVPRERVLGRPLWDEPRAAGLLEDGRPAYRQPAQHGPGRDSPAPALNRAMDIDYWVAASADHVAALPQGAHKTIRVLSFPVPTELGVMVGSFARDVTEELATTRKLALTERLETVGRLAGGIAHDFNNLLTVMVSHADFAGRLLGPGFLAREDLNQIRYAAERAASLTHQLLVFSRRQPMERRVLNLNDLFLGLKNMLRRLIREDILLLVSLAPDLWLTRADPGQIEQALTNLVINARDCIPRDGTITIETANATLDREYVRQHPDAAVGDYAVITVTDTGSGMSEDVMDHIIEPFFTTKEAGRGTGLGLPTVFGIVQQHQGYLWFHSELGSGSTFRIYLPRYTASTPEPATTSTDVPAAPTGTETVLVVEDDPSVRQVSCRILSGLGYRVLAAADGEEALRLAQEDGRHIDLLFTDVVMPRMGGRQLASSFQAIHPGTRVLFVSGHTGDAADHSPTSGAGDHFLSKPFTLAKIAAAVRAALDDSPANG
ncbi:MAG: PAS domain S-box protein [Anaerolineae bacterium]